MDVHPDRLLQLVSALGVSNRLLLMVDIISTLLLPYQLSALVDEVNALLMARIQSKRFVE